MNLMAGHGITRQRLSMKLEQGQIWKKGDEYIRIVEWARMSIQYKVMKNPATKIGTVHQAKKKDFCRLLKGAALVMPEKADNTEPEVIANAE
jgi:hypothetical protein